MAVRLCTCEDAWTPREGDRVRLMAISEVVVGTVVAVDGPAIMVRWKYRTAWRRKTFHVSDLKPL